MNRRGQAAIEFLLLFGFMLLVFTVAYLIIQERAKDRNEQAGVRELASIGHAIVQEVSLASRVHDGYNRTFDLPLFVTRGAYTITLAPANHPSEVILNDSEAEFVVFLPINLTTGSILVAGTNFISRTAGNITTGEAREPFCEDADDDMYDSADSIGLPACEQPNTDCDDRDETIYPGSAAAPDCERPNADQDCDGVENQYEGACLVCELPKTNVVYFAGGTTLSNGGLSWSERTGDQRIGLCCDTNTQCAITGVVDGCVAYGWIGTEYVSGSNREWVCGNLTATAAQPATGPKIFHCTTPNDGKTISNNSTGSAYCCSQFTVGANTGTWGFSVNPLSNPNKAENTTVAGSCSDSSDNDCDGKMNGYDDLCWSALVNSTCGLNSPYENLTAHPNSTMHGTTRIAYDWLLDGTSILVAQYTFDVNNSAGTNMTRDHSINGRNATFSATTATTPNWILNGRDGSGALVFDGIDDQANISTAAPKDAYTIEAWVRVPETKARRNIIVRSGSAGPLSEWSHQLRINNSATMAGEYSFEHYAWDEGSGKQVSVLGTSTITWPGWYHVVGTGASDGKLRLFVNGVEEGTPAAITTPWTTGAESWRIGPATGDGFLPYQGRIDEVRIYNRNITPEQVKANYLMGGFNRTVSQGLAGEDIWSVVLYPNNSTHDGSPITSNTIKINDAGDGCPAGGTRG